LRLGGFTLHDRRGNQYSRSTWGGGVCPHLLWSLSWEPET
jgi:hypothetical protein